MAAGIAAGPPQQPSHFPVMLPQVLEGLRVRPGGTYLDGTLGRGGHAQAVLEKLCLGQQKFTPLKSVSEDFWCVHPNPYIRLFRDLSLSENAVAIPQIGIWNEYNRELGNAADLIQNLKQPPALALADVQEKMQAALDRERKIFARRQAP